jgi:hypothetical protein
MFLTSFPAPRRWCCLSLLSVALLAGCATPGPSAPSPGAGAAEGKSPSFPGVSTPRPEPGALRAFNDVVRGATQQAGFLPIWRRDDKVWLEIPASAVDQPFLLSANVSHSVGERGLYASQMGPAWLVTFRKVGSNQMQLIALNTSYQGGGEAMKATVSQGFSHSLLASATLASAPHAERNSLLIDAGFLLSDIPGFSTSLERAFRMSYGLDRGNSYFETTRATEDLSSLNVRLHFSTARLPASPGVAPPYTTPDPRSFFIGYVYSFTRLPERPMAPRKADPRLGHFYDVVNDLGSDLKPDPRMHFVNRWRLEKRDPDAALSEPRQPIVYWLDKNIPPQYRKSVEAGVLEWNKAFERIGFKNAIVVRQQPEDADWDNMDARHASIRWYVGADSGTALGPHHSDPRTGEIIDADIAMSDLFGRGTRRFVVENVGFAQRHGLPQEAASAWPRGNLASHAFCDHAFEASAEMSFMLDMLEARGDIAPDSPEAEEFVQAVIKDTIMHEVGHTLGLKHNFKASTVFTPAQLRDKDFTEKNGISGSVMDYNAFNLPAVGEKPAHMTSGTLGPYDYWAIEYAYKPIPAEKESAELARIAARSAEPMLAYADDGDAGGYGTEGIDPLVNRLDLGADPLGYWQKRFKLTRELWQRVQDRPPQPDDEVSRQRRVLISGFRQLSRSAELVGKYVGGLYAVRDLPGTTGRAAYTPVEPAKQRQALQFLANDVFNADSFRFRPQFLTSLSPDYTGWDRSGPVSIPAAVLQLQSAALDRLMSPGTASRLLDLPLYVSRAEQRDMITLHEVYRTLQRAVWSELQTGAEIDRLRRNLQREHLRRVQNLLTRGSAALPSDALSLVRLHATELQRDVRRAAGNRKLSVESRAHLQDSLSQLTQALGASMQRF